MEDVRDAEKKNIYEQAGILAAEDSEESLEQAIVLYQSIEGWQDADRLCADCRTRLAQIKWQAESSVLKEYERQDEVRHVRRKRALIISLIAVLLCFSVIITVASVRFRRYSIAAEHLIAGEYELAADAFMEMADYRDSRYKVFEAAAGLYRNKEYAKALPYFIWLDGEIDGGYYLRKCRERLGLDP